MDRMPEPASAVSEPAAAAPGTGDVAFEDFFRDEHVRLLRALYLVTGNTQEAEEVMQDAFIAVWERWDLVGAMDEPTGYFCRTLRYRTFRTPVPLRLRRARGRGPGRHLRGERARVREPGRLVRGLRSGGDGQPGSGPGVKDHLHGFEPGDVVDAAGYPEAETRQVRVVRDGESIAVVEFFPDRQSGPLQMSGNACEDGIT